MIVIIIPFRTKCNGNSNVLCPQTHRHFVLHWIIVRKVLLFLLCFSSVLFSVASFFSAFSLSLNFCFCFRVYFYYFRVATTVFFFSISFDELNGKKSRLHMHKTGWDSPKTTALFFRLNTHTAHVRAILIGLFMRREQFEQKKTKDANKHDEKVKWKGKKLANATHKYDKNWKCQFYL